ncbi:cation-translocating P-type ATPase [Crenobacter luteus]|uniref:Carbonate dehydratase n=1 Tax=Crenobacter luteus TaxID=1452487 RepID=A0A165FKA8_9NEIS|nr:HAD-IC family P-type ATPase [Crenobacter luteus]KZE33542.1 carbonate dehydratase [Crenobacter luteus]
MREPPSPPPPWHALPGQDALDALRSGEHGLSRDEAAARLARHGPNALPAPPPESVLRRFLRQLDNLLIYVLLVAGAVTLLMGDVVDSAVILGVVLINATIGCLQEGRAVRALAAIRAMLSPRATVMRDGERHEIDAAALVPGDIVLLDAGDKVPADLRLVRARALRVDEAALTGESLPVDKGGDAQPADTPLAERRAMAYAGTLVCAGQARGLVVATGEDTELGRINRMLATIPRHDTPLTRRLERFTRTLTSAILTVAALTVALGTLWHGEGWRTMFLAGVSLAVAAIPEGLPAIVTIVLAIGVERMARHRAIVRRLPAVETLGSVTVICTDKTGTLTRNEMTAGRVRLADLDVEVSGSGYAPDGGLCWRRDDGTVPLAWGERPELDALLTVASLCNDARLAHDDAHGWQAFGDPTEAALVTLAHKAAQPVETLARRWPRVDALPFDAAMRLMATLHHDHLGHRLILIKGAPETVLARASRELGAAGERPLDEAAWLARADAMARDGYRVLALARREVDDDAALTYDDVAGLTLLGLVGLIDPPRDEAADAVARCREAGIRVKMITGDHAATAAAIGLRLGIGDGRRALSGPELDRMDAAALRAAVRDVDVFARASPEHKLGLVAALRANGEVIAMTGDGVNDAPALKSADIGVAMGGKGTEAAKEASAMVITDDNFATLAHAVAEGRAVYDNIRKAVLFILPTNVGQAAIVVAAVVAGLPLPISPLQILWINMVTAVTLALALAFEAPEDDVMRRAPRPPDEGLGDRLFVWRLVFVGALMVALPFGFYLDALGRAGHAYAGTLAVNAMVAIEIAYLFNSRRYGPNPASLAHLAGNRAALLACGVLALLQLAFTYLPAMQALFGTVALDGADWARAGAAALAVYLLIEGEKAVARRLAGGQPPGGS